MLDHVGTLRDVIYDLSPDETRWLTDLAGAFKPMMPGASMVLGGALRIHSRGLEFESVGPNTPALRTFIRMAAATLPRNEVRHVIQRASSTGSWSEWVQPLAASNFWGSFVAAGLRYSDFVGVRAVDGGDRFLAISAWFSEKQGTNSRQREVLEPIAAHIATMFRLRRSLRGA